VKTEERLLSRSSQVAFVSFVPSPAAGSLRILLKAAEQARVVAAEEFVRDGQKDGQLGRLLPSALGTDERETAESAAQVGACELGDVVTDVRTEVALAAVTFQPETGTVGAVMENNHIILTFHVLDS
jgi:hypothetical protein